MIISFTTVFAIAAGIVAALLLAAAGALVLARSARARARAAQSAADVALLRLGELETALAGAHDRLEALCAGQERAAAAPTRPSLREAVALSRHGASVDELVATCRIGQGEARLIQMLYGAGRPAAAERAADVH